MYLILKDNIFDSIILFKQDGTLLLKYHTYKLAWMKERKKKKWNILIRLNIYDLNVYLAWMGMSTVQGIHYIKLMGWGDEYWREREDNLRERERRVFT